MNRQTKKFLQSAAIFSATVIAGFIITIVSFRLFDRLTVNQMRLLFAGDIVLLLLSGALARFFSELRGARRRQANMKEKKHRSNSQIKKRPAAGSTGSFGNGRAA